MTLTEKTNVTRDNAIGSNVLQLKTAKLTITNKRYNLYPYSADTYNLIVYSARLANKLNKLLQAYPDYTIKEGEEAQFRFASSRLPEFAKYLRLRL